HISPTPTAARHSALGRNSLPAPLPPARRLGRRVNDEAPESSPPTPSAPLFPGGRAHSWLAPPRTDYSSGTTLAAAPSFHTAADCWRRGSENRTCGTGPAGWNGR